MRPSAGLGNGPGDPASKIFDPEKNLIFNPESGLDTRAVSYVSCSICVFFKILQTSGLDLKVSPKKLENTEIKKILSIKFN